MRTPEGYEKDDIKKYLDALGSACWYFLPFMSGYGKTGVPDIVGCKATLITPQMVGSTVGLWHSSEVKRPGKSPTVKQTKRMQEINLAGGKVFWGDAKKVIAEFEEWIK